VPVASQESERLCIFIEVPDTTSHFPGLLQVLQ
jgi:hypothetical protein